jgi:hypothetical protein
MPEAETTDTPSKQDPIEEEAERALFDWLSTFGATGAMRVALKRISPNMYKGVQVKGTLDDFEEPISEERIRQEHGGGRYQIVVRQLKKNARGNPSWKYAGARTFEIAGPPKVAPLLNADEEDDDDGNGQPGLSDGPVGQAMNMALSMQREARQEAREARTQQPAGMDHRILDTVIGPLRDEVSALRSQLADKERLLFDLANKPVDTTKEDRLLDIMAGKEQGHSNTLDGLRQAHEAEMRQLREFNREEIRRREDRFEREIDHVRQAATREIDSLKLAHQQALDSQRHGYEMRIDGLRDIQKRLEREVDATKKELHELRGKREQGPLDQIQNLANLKQGFDALIPADSGEKSGWEKAADVIGPVVERVAGAIGERNAPPGMEGAPQLVPIQLPDGRVAHVPPHIAAQAEAQRQAAEAAEQEPGEPPLPEIAEEDMSRAVTFMEAAIRNDTDPAVFAATARNMLPDDLLQALKRLGVDVFLNKMAKIETGSPLASVAGRMWVRQVAQFLIEGTIDVPDAPPPAEPQPPSVDDFDDLPDDLADAPVHPDSPVESP